MTLMTENMETMSISQKSVYRGSVALSVSASFWFLGNWPALSSVAEAKYRL